MTLRQIAWVVGGFGALTALTLLLGLDNLGGIMALIQLGLLVGSPLAYVLRNDLKSWQVVFVVSAALSVALTAITVQFLIWFRVAVAELVVVSATAYGVVLAWLLSSFDRADRAGRRTGAGGAS